MKTFTKTLLALTAGTLMTAGANAALYQTTNTGVAGQPYVGVKAGQYNTDISGDGIDSKKPTAYGIYAGYQFDPQFGAEIDYMNSDKADVDYNGVKVGTIKDQTIGAYGTYKYNFAATPVYGKAKLGIAQSKIKAEASSAGYSYKNDSSKTSAAGGLGLGYNVTPNVALEAEYNFLPKIEDVKTDAWTIGAHVKF